MTFTKARIGALVVDLICVGLFELALLYFSHTVITWYPLTIGISFMAMWLYFFGQALLFGNTLGKRVFGLEYSDSNWRGFFRRHSILFGISFFFAFANVLIGYGFIDSDRVLYFSYYNLNQVQGGYLILNLCGAVLLYFTKSYEGLFPYELLSSVRVVRRKPRDQVVSLDATT